MIRVTDAAITSLMAVYAPYFVEDFAVSTLSHLQGSYPVDPEFLNQVVQEKTVNTLTSFKPDLANPNAATRFLCECAQFALENDVKDKESRAVYDQIKALPSMHHTEITELAYSAAQLYQTTLDTTVIGVVAKDANEVSQLIANDIQSRVSQTDTGGRVKHFSWGLLSDGLWLNKALTQAFETAKIFRPGAEARLDWARTGFQFAHDRSGMKTLSRDAVLEANAAFETLLAHADEAAVNQTVTENAYSFKDLLFVNNAFNRTLDDSEKGLKDPRALVAAVSNLTAYITAAEHLLSVGQSLGEEIVPAFLMERMETIVKSSTLAMAGFEALRETRYADSLILYVDGNAAGDPTVDVFINKDNFTRFTNEGGEEAELVKIGNHLDPRSGTFTPMAGWNVDWALTNKNDIVAKVITEEEQRLERLRANDVQVIRSVVENRISEIAQSYNQACNRMELSKDVKGKITQIARSVTAKDAPENYSMATEITQLLCDVIDDPFVSRTTNLFVNAAYSEDETIRQNAKVLAIAGTAVHDAGTFFMNSNSYE